MIQNLEYLKIQIQYYFGSIAVNQNQRFEWRIVPSFFSYPLESRMYWGKSLVKANLVEDFSMFFLDVLSSVKRYTRKARGFYLSIWLALPSYEVLHNSGTLPQHRAKLGHRRLDKYLQLSKQPSRRGTGTYGDRGNCPLQVLT